MNPGIRIDIYSDFNLIDILNKCPYQTKEDALNDLKQCLVYCQSVPPVYMIKTYDLLNERPKISYSGEPIALQILKKIVIFKKMMREQKITRPGSCVVDNQLEFTVKGLKFYSEDPYVFSYFRGYDFNKLDEVKKELIQPFLNHVHEVIAAADYEIYKYILVWIASILQRHNFKTDTALIILGKQGTGKNTFFTDIICKLMARYANENITSIDSVISKFNAVLENKKLLILNELQSIESNKYFNSEALKSVITDKSININQKNEPERLCENVANFIMVSNNEISIKIESSDRRYVVTKTSDKYKGDFDYFGKLSDTFTPKFYENLFTFFMTMNISGYNLRKIPNTEEKENIKEASMSSYELFVREYYDKINDISGPDLFEMYENFIEKNRFQPCSSQTFIANMKQFTGSSKARWIRGKTEKGDTQSIDLKYRWFSVKRMNKLIEIYNNTFHTRIGCSPKRCWNNQS